MAQRHPPEAAKAPQWQLDGQLWDAAHGGDVAAIERLVAEGASPDAMNSAGEPALHTAAMGNAGTVSALVRLGADLNVRDSCGDTALMVATTQGDVQCVRALLAGGADRTLQGMDDSGYWRYEGLTAIELAEATGKAEVAALFRKSTAQIKAEQVQDALDKQLYHAAREGNAAAIERLVAQGASPNAEDKYAFDFLGKMVQTALMVAARMGQVECARALLDAGADRTLRATRGLYKGQTALEVAEGKGKAEVVTLLRE
jgi:ankyrin repeat protein